MQGKTLLYTTVGVAVVILGLFIVAFAWFHHNSKYQVKVEEGIDNQTFEEMWASGDFTGIEPRSQRAMWDTVHEMSNTIIKAVDGQRWGLIEITEELCNKLILELAAAEKEGKGYQDTERLMEILWRWKAGDLSQGVADHNYVWDRLGGTVGEAYDLQDDVKARMIEKGFRKIDIKWP